MKNEYEQIKHHIGQFKSGVITYDELVEYAQPIIDVMNAKNKIIAKRHGMRPTTVYLKSIIRNTY